MNENKYKKIKYIIPFILILVVVLISFFMLIQGIYKKNIFSVRLNDQDVCLYYTEKYTNYLIPLRKHYSESYCNQTTPINNIDLSTKMILSIDEYQVFDNSSRISEKNTWTKGTKYEYKEINNNKTLVIKRNNEILYSGKYIKDISKYVKEKGRYFFNVKSIRQDSILDSITTNISFNIIIGGGNNE